MGWGWSGIGQGDNTGREPDSAAICENCGTHKSVTMQEIAKAPQMIPECCGWPMAVPSLDEVDAENERKRVYS